MIHRLISTPANTINQSLTENSHPSLLNSSWLITKKIKHKQIIYCLYFTFTFFHKHIPYLTIMTSEATSPKSHLTFKVPLHRWIRDLHGYCDLNVQKQGATLPETNSWPLEMDGWKITYLLGKPSFRGSVSFREGIYPKQPGLWNNPHITYITG